MCLSGRELSFNFVEIHFGVCDQSVWRLFIIPNEPCWVKFRVSRSVEISHAKFLLLHAKVLNLECKISLKWILDEQCAALGPFHLYLLLIIIIVKYGNLCFLIEFWLGRNCRECAEYFCGRKAFIVALTQIKPYLSALCRRRIIQVRKFNFLPFMWLWVHFHREGRFLFLVNQLSKLFCIIVQCSVQNILSADQRRCQASRIRLSELRLLCWTSFEKFFWDHNANLC